MREIEASETRKLEKCLRALAEYHNGVSVNFKGGYPKDNRLFSAFMQNQTATADLTPAVRRAVQGLP